MKIHGLWNELPKCCQKCQNIKHGDINKDIFECSKNLILPTKKRTCGKQVKKREHIKERFKRFLIDKKALKNWNEERSALPWKQKPTSASRIIFNAFFWKDTFDGYNYWQFLHLEWEQIVKTEYPEYFPKG